MWIKYKPFIIITLLSCLLPLTINPNEEEEESPKQTEVIQVHPRDVIMDIPEVTQYFGETGGLSGILLQRADELSFRYVGDEVVPEDSGGVKGNIGDSINFNIPPSGGAAIVHQLEWKVVEMEKDSDSVTLGLNVKFKLSVEGRLGGITIEIPPLANKANKTVEIGNYALHGTVEDDSSENEDATNGNDGDGSSNGSGGGGSSHNNEEASYDSSDDVEWHDDDDYYADVEIGEIEVLGVVDDDDYYYYYYYEEEEGDYEDIGT